MTLLPAGELVRRAWREGYAVPSFCVWNSETIVAVLAVAQRMRAPVILMNGPGEFALFPPATMADLVAALGSRYHCETALHLDHGESLDQVNACLAAGYTSVMADYSLRSLDENTRTLAEVVSLSRPRGVSVEGELGAIGKVDSVTAERGDVGLRTDPGLAREYVRATGVDMLAVSIGNAHGIYGYRPRLDFELLGRIRGAAGVPLVLHGGSGTPEDDIRRAISLGIAKVNVASELVLAFRATLLESWSAGRDLWVPAALAKARPEVEAAVTRWIRRCGAEERS